MPCGLHGIAACASSIDVVGHGPAVIIPGTITSLVEDGEWTIHRHRASCIRLPDHQFNHQLVVVPECNGCGLNRCACSTCPSTLHVEWVTTRQNPSESGNIKHRIVGGI